MTPNEPSMIVSGVPYEVTEIDGKPPVDLSEFDGPVTMMATGPTGEHSIAGAGEHVHGDTVRVHEKFDDGAGKDVRVWTVSPDPEGDRFIAEG
jgi:hypothetical protein